MANTTTLNMQLLLRRDNVFTSTYKLAAGEPGFEISTNTLKVGQYKKDAEGNLTQELMTWAELPIANKEVIDGLIKAVDDKVAALNDTFATGAEVEAIRSALDSAKLDKATYAAYIATRSLTDSEINTAIDEVDARFASYRTAADQDGIDNAIKGRIDALEAVDHEHTNKALLDTYTQTDADIADAVAKKHAHTFNETELNKIAEGDVAKWNGVAADHLTSADKTTLEGKIADAKKAGTDADTYIKAYEVTNDARVKAVEDSVAEIKDSTDGILAQAKAYSDGKLATAKTEISAEIDADVKVVNDALEAYKSSNNTALAGVKATADAAAVKTEVESALALKADKSVVDAMYTNSQIDGFVQGAKDYADDLDDAMNTRVASLEAKFGEGEGTVEAQISAAVAAETAAREKAVADEKSARETAVAGVQNYAEGVAGRVTTAEGKIADLEAASATHALKTDVENEFAKYTTTEDQKAIDDAQDAKIKAIADDYLKAADKSELADGIALKADKSVVDAMYTNDQIDGLLDGKVDKTVYAEDKATFALKSEITSLTGKADKSYVDAELAKKVNVSDYTTDKATFATKTELEGVSGRVTTIEGILNDAGEGEDLTKGLVSRVADLEAIDHDKLAADASAAAVATVLDGAPEKFDTLKEIAAWIADADTAEDAASLVTRVSALEAIDHEAYVEADAELKEELEGKIDAINNHSHTFVEAELNEIKAGDVAKWNAEIGAKALAETKTTTAEVKDQIEAYGYATTGYADGKAADAQAAAEATAAGALATAVADLEGKIAAVDVGVMEVAAGEGIDVTPGENGTVTVAHKAYGTGTYTKPDSIDDANFVTGVTIENGHVTGASVKSLAEALMGMTFVFDGGTSSN